MRQGAEPRNNVCRTRHNRHAYATHVLEQGLPVHQLQRLLGHRNVQSTMRYMHWLPGQQWACQGHADVVAALEVGHD
ncbi:tyrosine-type recombinase/integrase [Aquisalimonas sp.]|uniref:tyrosine-type recombinase/integrase n=1 Tax=Aquisalimonas sp. TaxID=1872621 RepID=UPI0025BBB554|nr:tyrosine-type recombinase/integrase [Aquisalimonas sp.]